MNLSEISTVLSKWANEGSFHPLDYDGFVEWRAGEIARENIRDELIALFKREFTKGGNDES